MQDYFDNVRELCVKGHTKSEICRALQISDYQCKQALRCYDLTAPNKKQRIFKMFAEGVSGQDILESVGVTLRYFNKLRDEYSETVKEKEIRADKKKKSGEDIPADKRLIWLPLICIDGSRFEPIAARLGLIAKERNNAGRVLFELPRFWYKKVIKELDREAVYRPNKDKGGSIRVLSNYSSAKAGSDLFGVELYNID